LQVKGADDPQDELRLLENLLTQPNLDIGKRRAIHTEIRTFKAGLKGEAEARYEIELYFGRSRNFMTIHDLRFEVDGYAAQIDHMILNRLGEVWLCESKHFAEGVSVNDHGEWSAYWNGKPKGIPSPIDQNRRHELLLNRVFDDGLVPLPKWGGVLPMKPDLRSLVVVSNGAQIGRPRRHVAGLDQVIKVEKLEPTVRGAIDAAAPQRLLRLMTRDALRTFAERLASIHKPAATDWIARFGLKPLGDAPGLRNEPTRARRRGSGHRCAACGDPVSFAVVKFCWNNPSRFAGSVYCMACQPNYPGPASS
jgi:nuclease-like protein